MNYLVIITTNPTEKMKLLNCTLSFIDIIIFDLDEFDPGPIPGKSRLANYETQITNRIQQNKYPGLIVDIILDDYDREGADFSACVHFSASCLEEFVATSMRDTTVCLQKKISTAIMKSISDGFARCNAV